MDRKLDVNIHLEGNLFTVTFTDLESNSRFAVTTSNLDELQHYAGTEIRSWAELMLENWNEEDSGTCTSQPEPGCGKSDIIELSAETEAAILAGFGALPAGSCIYPGMLALEYGVDVLHIYRILESLMKKGKVRTYLEVACPKCVKLTGLRYPTISEMPGTVVCPHCGAEIENYMADTIVMYKKEK